MATKIKKISELEQIAELSSYSNVIIEENGKAKRFAASKFAVGGSSEQMQPDWNQNDPAQTDYVKNRTHWVEGEQTVIEWDSNGEYTIDGNFIKISDYTPTKEQMIGSTLEIVFDDGSTDKFEITEDNITNGNFNEGEGYFCLFLLAVVFSIPEGAPFSSTGVYYMPQEGMQRISISIGTLTYHTIPDDFISNTIARKSDVNTVIVNVKTNTRFVADPPDSGDISEEWFCVSDHTFDQVTEMVNAGIMVVAHLVSNNGTIYNIDMVRVDSNNVNMHVFSATNENERYALLVNDNNDWFFKRDHGFTSDQIGGVLYVGDYGYPRSAELGTGLQLTNNNGSSVVLDVSNPLPSVTTENNGAFLRVVDGAWVVVNLTDVSTEGA